MKNLNNLNDVKNSITEISSKAFDELKSEVDRQKNLLLVIGVGAALVAVIKGCCRKACKKKCNTTDNQGKDLEDRCSCCKACKCKECNCSAEPSCKECKVSEEYKEKSE